MSENRSARYKFGDKNDKEARRKGRQEEGIKLRKNAREEQMLKRRNICMDDVHTSPLKEINVQTRPHDHLPSIEEIVKGLQAADDDVLYEATQGARKMLSRERNPPIDDIIGAGILPTLVNFLQRDDNRKLQFEAAWALTNIASGASHQTAAVVSHGAVPSFVRLLHCAVPEVVEQAVWALGNIAGDGAPFRDQVLAAGVIEPLVKIIDNTQASVPFLQNISWTMSNLCRNKSGVTVQLIEMLNAIPDVLLLTPVLRTLGNIVTGTDVQTQTMLEQGLLSPFQTLLRHHKPNIVKEASWTLSNITAGTRDQIEQIISAGLLEELIRVLENGDFKGKKEATWAVTNLTSGGSAMQVFKLVELGGLKPLCAMLGCADGKIVQVVLDGLTNMLNMADASGKTTEMTTCIEEADAIDMLEKLQEHENEDIYKAALNIVETWFSEEEDPQPASGDVYSFQAPKEQVPAFSF
ncbi:Oidioi.mRNA.OKI2018_I69.XSR.g15284.t1.cds [Oikopleura dioica]|uniref:Importin subunit alpha n=1 Tax=Oikopleura dioica TaxID=34765 RepID=A0ABN7SCC1_OIKDI|nr:Oidioi.mRNA.OKI2018_I69.XSR.g15284.t1.cds [Oikopleura dioica]